LRLTAAQGRPDFSALQRMKLCTEVDMHVRSLR
jgi:hypothetical protein